MNAVESSAPLGRPITIGIVEDQGWMLRGLHATFDNPPETRVLWEARSVAEAERRFQECVPDVLLVDHRLDGEPAGVPMAQRWVRERPGIRVLILTAHEESEIWGQAKAAGLAGLVIKKAGDASLVEAVRVVAQGGSWFEPPSLPWHLLSPAEVAVLVALEARGTAKEAAASMQPPLSTRTVESHLQNIYGKLGIRNAKELLRHYRIEKKP